MRHKVIIKRKVVNLYIRRCHTCNAISSITFGKRSVMCMDCLKKLDNWHLHIPRILYQYNSKQLIIMIKNKEVEEIKISRQRRKMSIWMDVEDVK